MLSSSSTIYNERGESNGNNSNGAAMQKAKICCSSFASTAVVDVARQNNLTPVQSKTGSTHFLQAGEQGLKAGHACSGTD